MEKYCPPTVANFIIVPINFVLAPSPPSPPLEIHEESKRRKKNGYFIVFGCTVFAGETFRLRVETTCTPRGTTLSVIG